MPNPPKLEPNRGPRGRGITLLSPGGRLGGPPRWPLPGAMSPDEADAWVQLWKTPQATMWETLGWTRTVARYCRVMVLAEAPEATAALLAQTLALEDRLGLTPKAMRLLLWQIAVDEVAGKRDEKQAETAAKSARERFKAVG